MKKYLYQNNKYYGYIGENTNISDYKVGDLVLFSRYNVNHAGLIIKNLDSYTIFGWACIDITTSFDISIVCKIIPAELMTNEIISKLTNLKIKEKEEKEITISEIENILGYKIKIVNSKQN